MPKYQYLRVYFLDFDEIVKSKNRKNDNIRM